MGCLLAYDIHYMLLSRRCQNGEALTDNADGNPVLSPFVNKRESVETVRHPRKVKRQSRPQTRNG